MLYDPKWATPSLAGFIGWLETHDPREKYNFENCEGKCLLGQYMAAIGIEWGETPKTSHGGDWKNTAYREVSLKIFGYGPLTVLVNEPHTFGAALDRARKLAAQG